MFRSKVSSSAQGRFLSCSCCSEVFNGEDRSPRFLPCGHTMCLDCIARKGIGADDFFPVNAVALSVLSCLSVVSDTSMMICDECGDRRASVFNKRNMISLCSRCHESNLHSLTSSEYPTDSILPIASRHKYLYCLVKCAYHPFDNMTLYCAKCRCICCWKCGYADTVPSRPLPKKIDGMFGRAIPNSGSFGSSPRRSPRHRRANSGVGESLMKPKSMFSRSYTFQTQAGLQGQPLGGRAESSSEPPGKSPRDDASQESASDTDATIQQVSNPHAHHREFLIPLDALMDKIVQVEAGSASSNAFLTQVQQHGALSNFFEELFKEKAFRRLENMISLIAEKIRVLQQNKGELVESSRRVLDTISSLRNREIAYDYEEVEFFVKERWAELVSCAENLSNEEENRINREIENGTQLQTKMEVVRFQIMEVLNHPLVNAGRFEERIAAFVHLAELVGEHISSPVFHFAHQLYVPRVLRLTFPDPMALDENMLLNEVMSDSDTEGGESQTYASSYYTQILNSQRYPTSMAPELPLPIPPSENSDDSFSDYGSSESAGLSRPPTLPLPPLPPNAGPPLSGRSSMSGTPNSGPQTQSVPRPPRHRHVFDFGRITLEPVIPTTRELLLLSQHDPRVAELEASSVRTDGSPDLSSAATEEYREKLASVEKAREEWSRRTAGATGEQEKQDQAAAQGAASSIVFRAPHEVSPAVIAALSLRAESFEAGEDAESAVSPPPPSATSIHTIESDIDSAVTATVSSAREPARSAVFDEETTDEDSARSPWPPQEMRDADIVDAPNAVAVDDAERMEELVEPPKVVQQPAEAIEAAVAQPAARDVSVIESDVEKEKERAKQAPPSTAAAEEHVPRKEQERSPSSVSPSPPARARSPHPLSKVQQPEREERRDPLDESRRISAVKGHRHQRCLSVLGKGGQVMTWGYGRRGRLGFYTHENHLSPLLLKSLAEHEIVRVACGGAHVIALGASGRVWAWGGNDYGQLGLSLSDVASLGLEGNPTQFPPVQVSTLTNERVIQVACGASHSLCLTESNRVYGWGSNATGRLALADLKGCVRTPLAISVLRGDAQRLDGEICEICAGGDFSVVLTTRGCIYSWGGNGDGQLGLGDTISRSAPERVHFDCTIEPVIVDVSCGFCHVACLASDGTVWMWGSNAVYQLGVDEDSSNPVHTEPVIVEALSGKGVVRVQCGIDHSMALTDAGVLYVWGFNEFGQLGLGHADQVTRPTVLDPGTCLTVVMEKERKRKRERWWHVQKEISRERELEKEWEMAREMQRLLEKEQEREAVMEEKRDALVARMRGKKKEKKEKEKEKKEKKEKSVAKKRSDSKLPQPSEEEVALAKRIEERARVEARKRLERKEARQREREERELAREEEETRANSRRKVLGFACGSGYHSILQLDDGYCYAFGTNTEGQLGTGDDVDRSHPVRIDAFEKNVVSCVAVGDSFTVGIVKQTVE